MKVGYGRRALIGHPAGFRGGSATGYTFVSSPDSVLTSHRGYSCQQAAASRVVFLPSCTRQNGSCVSGHVVITFGIVPIFGIPIGCPAIRQRFQVLANGSVGVLGNHQRTACVLYKNKDNSCPHRRSPNHASNLCCDLGGAATTCLDRQSVLERCH
jgi:hypothetical protein